MAIYKCTNDLRDKTLKENDTVIFNINSETFTYIVRVSHLSLNSSSISNNIIFNRLELDRLSFSSNAYGYETELGSWPVSKTGDFHALTRLVLALFSKIEIPEVVTKDKQTNNIKIFIENEIRRNARTVIRGKTISGNTIRGRTNKIAISKRCSINTKRVIRG